MEAARRGPDVVVVVVVATVVAPLVGPESPQAASPRASSSMSDPAPITGPTRRDVGVTPALTRGGRCRPAAGSG